MHLPRVWAEVDLRVIAANLNICRRLLSESCRILGVVKADAYGHGAVRVASTLEASGVSMLGVGDSHEAIQLRAAGIGTSILILGAVVEGEIPELVRHRITPMVHSPERITMLARVARKLGIDLPVHLFVDTGMRRLGVAADQARRHVDAIAASTHLVLAGIGTHLASPSEDPAFTREQIRTFRAVLASLPRPLPPVHVASSAALLSYPECHHDMVRLGGLLYGIPLGAGPSGLQPALSLYTQIIHLRDVPANCPIGYGGTYRTRRPTRLATLPIGYHDGYLHGFSNRGSVLVRGRPAPVVGRVSMEYTVVDVSEVPGASVADRVTLLGKDGEREISVRDMARWARTIPYEIPSLLGRVRRFYHHGEPRARRERTIAWENSRWRVSFCGPRTLATDGPAQDRSSRGAPPFP